MAMRNMGTERHAYVLGVLTQRDGIVDSLLKDMVLS